MRVMIDNPICNERTIINKNVFTCVSKTAQTSVDFCITGTLCVPTAATAAYTPHVAHTQPMTTSCGGCDEYRGHASGRCTRVGNKIMDMYRESLYRTPE